MPGIADYVLSRLRSLGGAEVLHARPGGRVWTATELVEAVEESACGLLDLGIEKQDRIGLVADNHDYWLITDLASLLIGAVDVPRAADASADEIAFVLRHSGCRHVFIESSKLADSLRPRLDGIDLANRVTVLDSSGDDASSLAALRARGRARLNREPHVLAAAASRVDDAALATIVYTSGTTGNPKGVMLSHGNILHNVRHLPDLVGFNGEDVFLSFLPSWHTFERTLEYCLLAAGASIHYSTKAALRKDLVRVRPTVVAGVPRLWESFQSSVVGRIEKLTGWRRRLADAALASSLRYCAARRRLDGHVFDDSWRITRARGFGRIVDGLRAITTRAGHAVADRLLYGPLRSALGGRIRFMVSGGGALPLHVDEFFLRAGLPLLNGYGLTETSPVICVRDRRRNVVGSAGRLLPETSWQVRDEAGERDLGRRMKGVLWLRGPQVMQGYYDNPTATSFVLRDGWFCSGDLAALTDEDDVAICGRAKDTIVLRGGENVEPELIEAQLVQSPLIADCVVVGHTKKHLAALVVADLDMLKQRLPDLGSKEPAELVLDPRVPSLIHAEIGRLVSSERGFRGFERVPKMHCLTQAFSVEDGTLTATMKKRRPVIESRYQAEIERLFDD